jgi:hypothetical protein
MQQKQNENSRVSNLLRAFMGYLLFCFMFKESIAYSREFINFGEAPLRRLV